MPHFSPLRRLLVLATAASTFAVAATAATATTDLPGKGVKVLPLKSSIAEETFQTLLVMKALTQLGYDVVNLDGGWLTHQLAHTG